MNLTSIPLYWLTIPKNKFRQITIEAILDTLQFTNHSCILGEYTNPYTKGIAMQHLAALENPGKLIIIEDDCQLMDNFTLELNNIPEDADAIYLGTSLFGRVNKETRLAGLQLNQIDDLYSRVYNMLSLHAVLYLTESYKSTVREYLSYFIENPGSNGCDDIIADNMSQHNIYALNNPIFYQNDGHSEYATKTSILSLT